LTRDQFLRESPHRLNIGRCPPSVDLDVAALRPAKLSEFRPQRRDPGLRFMVALGKGHQDADASHGLGLLRACRERPSSRAADQGDEAAPFQLIEFPQVAAIRKARSIPEGGDQVRTCAVQDFGRAAVRCGSKPEFTATQQQWPVHLKKRT
jgi:hypothetical protein